MKELTFNKSSWHGRLAYTYGSLAEWETETDICTYTRAAVGGLIKVLLALVGVGLVVVAPLADFLVWLWVGVAHTWVEPNIFATMFMALVGAILAVTLGVWGAETLQDKYRAMKRRRREQRVLNSKPDGFVKAAYASFKGKYCVKVKVVDNNTNDSVDKE